MSAARGAARSAALAAVLLEAVLLAAAALPGWADSPGPDPLPPLQGHQGEEVYSFPFPDDTSSDSGSMERYVAGYLATRRAWLQTVLDRSLKYRTVIVLELAERGLPRELLFLPVVESGYEPRATSPRGAAGLWQLMRNTAAPYGLRMDQWLDERRGIFRSTEASLGKLAENYGIFGDWPLALAAYNCGVGKLSGIMKRNPGNDYWALRARGLLPRETAGFVPQFLALTRILSHPGRYGLEVGWDPVPEWERIPLSTSVDLRVLARASGVPLDVLTSSNPELNLPITPPAGYRYELSVPAQYAAAVKEAIASAAVPLMEFRIHVVAAGDTLYGLARRYGVTADIIREFNPKVAPRALQIGTRLLVPVGPVRSAG